MTRRYVVVGAGAVGAALAAGLRDAGVPVILVSRGTTHDAIRERGLTFTHEGRSRVLDVEVAGTPRAVALGRDDVLLLAVKSQDAASALAEWAAQPVGSAGTAGELLPVVTLQNGLDAERSALRHFATVVAGVALTAARHVVPGEVTVRNTPRAGQLIVGPYPHAAAAPHAAQLVGDIARDLRTANWLVHEADDPRPWKSWKLQSATTFAAEVFSGPQADRDELSARLRDEATTILTCAGHTFADPATLSYDPSEARVPQARRTGVGGLSTWQSFERGSGSEVDFLAGEVVLQARLLGIPAPVSIALQNALAAAAAAGERPGVREARALLDDALTPTGASA